MPSRTGPVKSPFFRPSEGRAPVELTPGGRNTREIKEAKSTIIGCSANLVNAIVGSGIVGLPFAMAQAGWGAGVGLVILCALLTRQSLRLLISTAKQCHTASYETLAEAAFGNAGFIFVAVNMVILALGAMLSYLMIVKDTAAALFHLETVEQERAALIAISCLIIVPLSCQRDMANLAWTSRLSVVLDMFLVAFVVYDAPISMADVSEKLQTEAALNPKTVFVGLGVLSFAFVCQHSAFLIAGSLQRPTHTRWSTVTTIALSGCAVLALFCGISGYLGYGMGVKGNILLNLPNTLAANMARVMLGMTMLFVYPLESFVARHVVVALFFEGRRAHEGNEDSILLNRTDRRVGLTVALYLCAVVPACIFQNLGNVLAITGAVGGSCISYLGPGVVYLAIHGKRFLELVNNSQWFGAWFRSSRFFVKPVPSASEKRTLLYGTEANNDEPVVETVVNDDSRLAVGVQTFLAYALGMPVWCAVARRGERTLAAFMHQQALKSPHPLRIGDVQYEKTRDGTTTVSKFARRTDPLRTNKFAVKTLDVVLEPLSKPSSTPIPPISAPKPDPDNELVVEQDNQLHPGWYNFIEAIFFCVFGLVALVAGIGSCFFQL